MAEPSDDDHPLHPVAGIALGTAAAGIRYRDRDDSLVIALDPGGQAAVRLTRNAFRAAPIGAVERHRGVGPPRFLMVHAGNALAGLGAAGDTAVAQTCAALAAETDCPPERIWPFATGVIGEPVDTDRLIAGARMAARTRQANGWAAAARAIMTTDTRLKGRSRRVALNGDIVTVTGIAKGAGMIRPDMATLLAFIATDAQLSDAALNALLDTALDQSFHRITVDGDTSTNDAAVLLASGQRGPKELSAAQQETLEAAVVGVARDLAQDLVRDAEGATRFVTVEVRGGEDTATCLAVAWTVAESPLVKTALFAGDPNWGRILAAVGRAGIPDLVVEDVDIHLGSEPIVTNGARHPDYDEGRATAVMAASEVTITIDLGRGEAVERVWTSDLSHAYVTINAEYRS